MTSVARPRLHGIPKELEPLDKVYATQAAIDDHVRTEKARFPTMTFAEIAAFQRALRYQEHLRRRLKSMAAQAEWDKEHRQATA